MPIENILKSLGKGLPLEELNTENLVMESLRDLVKDEIKSHLRKKIEEQPELKDELKGAIELFLEAKMRETFATLKLAKAGTKLGLTMVPDKILDDLGIEFSKVFEKELFTILEKSID
jgi:hypothetical protein